MTTEQIERAFARFVDLQAGPHAEGIETPIAANRGESCESHATE
jgi:hypothetical protein